MAGSFRVYDEVVTKTSWCETATLNPGIRRTGFMSREMIDLTMDWTNRTCRRSSHTLHVWTHDCGHLFILKYLLIYPVEYETIICHIIGWQTVYHVFVVNQKYSFLARPGLTLRAEGLYFLRVGWPKKLDMCHDTPWKTWLSEWCSFFGVIFGTVVLTNCHCVGNTAKLGCWAVGLLGCGLSRTITFHNQRDFVFFRHYRHFRRSGRQLGEWSKYRQRMPELKNSLRATTAVPCDVMWAEQCHTPSPSHHRKWLVWTNPKQVIHFRFKHIRWFSPHVPMFSRCGCLILSRWGAQFVVTLVTPSTCAFGYWKWIDK